MPQSSHHPPCETWGLCAFALFHFCHLKTPLILSGSPISILFSGLPQNFVFMLGPNLTIDLEKSLETEY